MGKWMDLRSLLIAAAFLTIGFLVADRMQRADATAAPVRQDQAPGTIDGTSGTTLVTVDRITWVVTIRDKKIWRVPFERSGDRNQVIPWAVLAD